MFLLIKPTKNLSFLQTEDYKVKNKNKPKSNSDSSIYKEYHNKEIWVLFKLFSF